MSSKDARDQIKAEVYHRVGNRTFRACLLLLGISKENRDHIINPLATGHEQLRTKIANFGKVEEGQYRLSPTQLYVGEMKKGFPDGYGTIIELQGSGCAPTIIYEGYIFDKLYHGKGKRYSNGYLIEDGVFVNGVITEGIRYYQDGSIYSGYFSKNKRHGNGRMVFPNGFFYSCTWVEDSPGKTITASFPSARKTTEFNLEKQNHVTVHSDRICIYDKLIWYILYQNGDVYVGGLSKERLGDGYYYRYHQDVNKNEAVFIRSQFGNGGSSRAMKPEMTIVDQYKYFKFT